EDRRPRAVAALKAAGALMGFFGTDPAVWFRGERADGPSDAEIDALLAKREAARRGKDFATADQIRNELDAAGVAIEDGPGGASWRRK
ncbi:MAG: cysteine--tRNA ligase, partial [Pseudomonadota bacterium]